MGLEYLYDFSVNDCSSSVIPVFLSFFLSFFQFCFFDHATCGILGPGSEIEPMASALEAWNQPLDCQESPLVLFYCHVLTYPDPENVRYFSDHFQYIDCKQFLKAWGCLPDSLIDLYKRT